MTLFNGLLDLFGDLGFFIHGWRRLDRTVAKIYTCRRTGACCKCKWGVDLNITILQYKLGCAIT